MKQTEIASLLPGIFQRTLRPNSVLATLLAIMESMHAPSEDVLQHLDGFFDPYRTPDHFVAYLSGWVDLERLLAETPEERAMTAVSPLPTGLGRLRELVAAAAYLSQWRGTKKGLQRFLETAIGIPGFEIDEHVIEAGRPKPFHIHIRAPQGSAPYRVIIERIIEQEKPAYVTYDLEIAE
jgi:phage tail-like protein